MKITIKASELKRILSKLEKHGTKKSSTNTCQIRVTDDQVEIGEFYNFLCLDGYDQASHNFKFSYSHPCLISEVAFDCTIKKTGSACIRSDSMLAILKWNASSEFITIEKKESFLLITRENGKQDEIPLLEDRSWDRGKTKIEGSLESEDMIRLLDSSLFIAPKKVSSRNPFDRVIRMSLGAHEISLVSTDKARLSANKEEANVQEANVQEANVQEANVHAEVFKILKKEIKKSKCKYVKIVMYEQSTLFTAGNTIIEEESGNLEFPIYWKEVIPKPDPDLTFSCKRAELENAIKNLAEGKSVTLDSSKNKMQIKKMIPSEDEKFKYAILMSILNKSDSFDKDTEGGKKESGFNIKFVLDALKSIHDEDVDIYINSNSVSPSLLILSEKSLNIIMSIKLD